MKPTPQEIEVIALIEPIEFTYLSERLVTKTVGLEAIKMMNKAKVIHDLYAISGVLETPISVRKFLIKSVINN